MKTPRLRMIFFSALGVAWLGLTGCSTPEKRIEKAPEAFATLTPAHQDLVRKGQVALGMDRTAVELALGKPDRTRTRADAEGKTEVWLYMAHEGTGAYGYGYGHGSLYYGHGFYAPYGARWWGAGPMYYGGDYESYPRLKVEFEADRVSSVEQEAR